MDQILLGQTVHQYFYAFAVAEETVICFDKNVYNFSSTWPKM